MRSTRFFPRLLGISLLGIATIGAWMGFQQWRYIKIENQRDDTVHDMVDQIRLEGQTSFVVDAGDFAVSGEDEYESSSGTKLSERNFTTASGTNVCSTDTSADGSSFSEGSAGNEYALIVYGTISIPSIDCELPLLDGAGVVELRYGAGRMPLSAEVGEAGNLVIFGHRMKRYGSLFNRLGEVECGNSIFVSRGGTSYEYVIDEILTISPSALSRYIQNEGDSSRITLVTCTPIGVGSHRLILRGHLLADQ